MSRSFTAKLIFLSSFTAIALVWFLCSRSSSIAPGAQAQRSGASVYSQNCARCHGSDGRAQTTKGRQLKAVDLTSDDWTPDTDHDTRMINRGKGSMPGFKNKLTANDVSAVVAYIRRFKH